MYINPKIVITNCTEEKEDFFCATCNFCLITNLDFELHKKFNTCEECYHTFVEPDIDSWNNDRKQIDKKKLNEYIYLRKKLSTKKLKLQKS